MRSISSSLMLLVVVGLGCATGTQPNATSDGTGAAGATSANGGGGSGAGTSAAGGQGGASDGGGGSGAGTSTGGAGGDGGSGGDAGQGGSPQGGGGTGGAGPGGAGGTGGGPGHRCGDGVVDAGEECDASELNGQTCESLGFVGGTLTCSASCKLDVSKCDKCGNGSVEPQFGEECDFDATGDPLVLTTCAGLGFGGSTANPGCDPTCHYDTGPCLCGDGVADADEDCDGADFDGKTCATFGFAGGMLSCTPECNIVATGCSQCGNGMVEAGEQCDDGNVVSGDGCSATCQMEGMTCDPDGTYVIQGGAVSYSCCSGLVSVNVSSFLFSANGATVFSSPSSPVPMTGAETTCPSGSFSNSGSILGGCTETYSLSGTFTGPDTWSGVYSVSFTGQQCDCFGGLLGAPCVSQVYSITAMR